jgi:hypothetical protein
MTKCYLCNGAGEVYADTYSATKVPCSACGGSKVPTPSGGPTLAEKLWAIDAQKDNWRGQGEVLVKGKWLRVEDIARDAARELASLAAQRDKAHARAIVVEHHKALELMSRGSAVEQLEMKLRTQLAEVELRAEAAEAQVSALRELMWRWRLRAGAIIDDVNLGNAPSHEADRAGGWNDCADELEAALSSAPRRDPA